MTVSIISNMSFAVSKACYTECRTRVSAIADTKTREGEFLLCCKLCTMEELNPSVGTPLDEVPPETESRIGPSFLPPGPAQGDQGTKPESPPDVTNENSCSEDFDAEVSACEAATLKAAKSCNADNSGLSNAANIASQTALLAGQKGAMGIQESCSKMADVAKAANIAVVGYRLLCGNAIKACTSACAVPLIPKCEGSSSVSVTGDARTAMAGNLSSCQSFLDKMSEAAAAAQNYSLMEMNSQSCSLLSNGVTASEICKSNPDYPGCTPQEHMDCTNPKMAENKVCVCSKTPYDPMCTPQSKGANEKNMITGADRRMNKGSAGVPIDVNDSWKDPAIAGSNRPASEDSTVIDGKQGGNPNLGSANLGPGLQKRLKEKKGIGDHPVLGGTYGNGGHSGEKKYEKLQLEDGSVKTEKNGNAKTGVADAPDLRKYLPGANGHGYRGIAGSTENIGIDGITGPHTSLWKKIQNRYRSIQDTLYP